MAIIRHLEYVGTILGVLLVLSVAVIQDEFSEHELCRSIPGCHCHEPWQVLCSGRNLTNLALPESTTNIKFRNVYGYNFNISRLQILIWQESGIKNISSAILSPINLEILDLSGNNVEYLQYNQFLNFTKLKYLNLSNNSIYDLHRMCFNGLNSLEELNLSFNKLHALPFQVFDNLKNLTKLDLSHNNMVTFLDHFFKQNGLIKTLLINDNRIEKLTSNSLTDLAELRTLNLSRNNLSTFTKGLFDRLNNLENLDIGSNPIKNLYLGVFAGLKSLKSLNMGHNYLRSIPTDIFYNMNELVNLTLDATEIDVLENGELKGLYNLHMLLLRDNKKLKKIEHRVFFDTPKLRHLNISGNALTFLPLSMANLTELTVMDMAENVWACDCRMKWFYEWANMRRNIFKTALSCGPGTYPNDMLVILQIQNCTVPRLIYKTPTTR